MKKRLSGLGLALLAGLLAFFATRGLTLENKRSALVVDQLPELAWLKSEIHLSDEELAKVKALHLAYRPKCLEMCRGIAEARQKLQEAAQAQREWNPGLEQAVQEHARVQADCQRAMLQHLYATAAVLRQEKAELFLKATLPAALGGYHGDEPDSCHDR
jgi:hypothetical protein